MSEPTPFISFNSPPPTVDTIHLRNIQLQLPTAPEAWHRTGTPQPCTASLRFSYSSSVAAAEADDVACTIDYGKLFRRIIRNIQDQGEATKSDGCILGDHITNTDGTSLQEMLYKDISQDVRFFPTIIARCCLEILDECAEACPHPTAINPEYGHFDIQLHLPKAILRADGGFSHQSTFAIGRTQNETSGRNERCLVLLDEVFEVRNIRCFCILGINPWEKLEKQAVNVSLKFKGVGGLKWGTTVVETYQAMVRELAERVENTSFGSVEALASFIARICTMDFGNEEVTVLVEKPNALAFVGGSGLEITRSRAFFQ
ncbi:dihydroneopterin aldolase domain protein [Aspergillus steynii IBT 23096]|uniref:dihydroneopterin aldolase n=1 Tax=Aspergillus steynii IBT 23096 TaxID=1392250 RepID=A0A2I2G123_9EURO|nr:dihydroneopterin aldolase domain protein [Aspergillus steynii IBT 23096]PLB46577.1 dihydroneopterin aldolase domain protein [Aspergillus steynii IBT 23096]